MSHCSWWHHQVMSHFGWCHVMMQSSDVIEWWCHQRCYHFVTQVLEPWDASATLFPSWAISYFCIYREYTPQQFYRWFSTALLDVHFYKAGITSHFFSTRFSRFYVNCRMHYFWRLLWWEDTFLASPLECASAAPYNCGNNKQALLHHGSIVVATPSLLPIADSSDNRLGRWPRPTSDTCLHLAFICMSHCFINPRESATHVVCSKFRLWK